MGFPGKYDPTTNGRQLSSKLWRDFNPMALAGNPADGWMVIDDFHQSGGATDWTLTNATAGTGALDPTEQNGSLLIDAASTTDNQGVTSLQYLGMCATPAAGNVLAYEVRAKVNVIAKVDLFLGMASTDTDILGTLPTDYAGFYVVDVGSGLTFGMQDGTEETSSGDVHTLVADTYVKLGFRLEYGKAPECYVNGEEVITGISSDAIPDSLLRPSYECHCGTGTPSAQPELNLDWHASGFLTA